MRLAASAMAVLVLASVASAAPTVYVEPGTAEVDQGQTLEVGIRVDAGTDTLTCFLVELTFDAGVIELLSAVEGTLFAESGHATMFDWDEHLPGLHSFNDVTLGFDSFVLCPGELVHLEFLAVQEGVTALSLTAVDLRDLRREPILPVYTEGGVVTVGPGTGVEGEAGDTAGDAPPVLRCGPNPFSHEVSLEIESGEAAGRVAVAVYDAAGHLVARPAVARCGAGADRGSWAGDSCDGRPLPGGVYFIVASGPHGRSTKRVTLIR